MGVLDSRSEIITMLKRIWEELELPIHLDHTMKMSFANTSVDSTIGVLKNLAINFSLGKVILQVQVLAHINFDLLLGHPFHCLMSVMIKDFLDGS